MDYNYHTHTFRCRHADGTPEEYVLRAIAGGIKHMGFSEHFPYAFPDAKESYYRLPCNEVGAYFDELNALKARYQKDIDIKIGFEMEYYADFFDDMLTHAQSYGADYLILGQHFLRPEYFPGERATITKTDDVLTLAKYVDAVVSAIKTNVFTYVAHPDIFNFTGDPSVYREEMRKICIASRDADVPLEINMLGIRTHRNYPNPHLWAVAGEVGAPVTIGCDAHDAENACDKASLVRAMELIDTYHLNYVGKPTLKPLSLS